ncbi:F0F1 ATP synthase subunit epsilon [Methylothermus subterraneus]
MRLKVLLPERVLLEAEIVKLIAEGGEGHFCLKPRHVDFVAALVPGILSYVEKSGKTWYLALDEGILVKRQDEVLVSTYKAVLAEDIAGLREKVQTEILKLNETERATRSALARLEAGILRRYGELREVFK